MDKDNLRKKRSKIVIGFLYFVLLAGFLVLFFDSNPDNNPIGAGLFMMYWFIRILRHGLRERAEGHKNRALFHFGMAGFAAIVIVAVGVLYVWGL